MMTILAKTVRLSAQLRQLAGSKEVQVAIPPQGTVRDLMLAITHAYPALGAFVLDEQGTLKPGIQLLVDGRHIDFLQGMDTPISATQDLFLIPPVMGG